MPELTLEEFHKDYRVFMETQHKDEVVYSPNSWKNVDFRIGETTLFYTVYERGDSLMSTSPLHFNTFDDVKKYYNVRTGD